MYLFRFVSGKEVVCYRDAVPVHKEPEFYDRVRTVVLFRPAFPILRRNWIAVLVYGIPVIAEFIHIRMAYVEVVVCAVEVGYRHVPFAYLFRAFIDPLLQRLLVVRDDVQCMVNVIEREAVEWFKKEILVFKRIFF